MKKIGGFQITGMTLSGFKSYQTPTDLEFGPITLVTGGNGRGKTSVADAIAFAITGLVLGISAIVAGAAAVVFSCIGMKQPPAL